MNRAPAPRGPFVGTTGRSTGAGLLVGIDTIGLFHEMRVDWGWPKTTRLPVDRTKLARSPRIYVPNLRLASAALRALRRSGTVWECGDVGMSRRRFRVGPDREKDMRTRTMRSRVVIGAIGITSLMGLAACSDDDDDGDDIENEIDEGTEELEDEAEDLGDEVEEGTDDLTDDMDDDMDGG